MSDEENIVHALQLTNFLYEFIIRQILFMTTILVIYKKIKRMFCQVMKVGKLQCQDLEHVISYLDIQKCVKIIATPTLMNNV